jgi:trimeric autotransporter adhesin
MFQRIFEQGLKKRWGSDLCWDRRLTGSTNKQTTNKKPLLNKEGSQTMKSLIKLKTTTLLVIPLVLACFALLPSAQAATPELLPAPAPDGAYTGFNTAEGLNALFNVNTAVGQFNTALGFAALKFDTTGAHNTGVGAQALLHNTLGSFNTAIGENAMVHNTTGSMNMALGQGALQGNLIGSSNTAMGFQALNADTVSSNTAVGFQALRANTTGGTIVAADGLGPNTAIGAQALLSNITGSNNNAVGYQALVSNDGVPPQGSFNNAHGNFALALNTTGRENNAFGDQALAANVTGNFNTAIGDQAGSAIKKNWNIDIGKDVFGDDDESFVTRIGRAGVPASQGGTDTTIQQKCFVGGIYGVVEPVVVNNVFPVFINSAGQLGTQPPASSARFKRDIKPMDKTSEGILAFKPVTFHYKSDAKGTPQFGLIAEEVAKVNPDLVVRDDKGEVYSVRYDAVNAMLLNEFLKEHRKVEQLKNDFQATVAQEQKEIQALTAQLKEQASQIQKVSAQLEVSKSAPKTVLNNQ